MARKKKKNRVPTEVGNAVVERAHGNCEIMNPDAQCTGYREHLHHRKLRSQGGEHTVENLVGVCHRCHYWLHAHPAISYANGWLVKGAKDPAKIPFRRRGILSYLHEDGGLTETDIEPLEI